MPSLREEGGLTVKSRSNPKLPQRIYFPNSIPSPGEPWTTQSDTFKCDNGTPNSIGGNDSIIWMEALKFTTTDSCSLYALLFWPADPDSELPRLPWRIWADSSGLPGAVMDSGVVSPIYGTWYQITLPDTEKIYLPSGTVFYIGWTSEEIPFYYNAFDDTSGTENCNYWFNGSFWEIDSFWGGDFLVRGLCETIDTVGVEEESDLRFEISDFRLLQNQPNPFHHTTTIQYQIPLNPPLLKGEMEGDFTKGGKGDFTPLPSLSYQGGVSPDRKGVFVHLAIYDITGRLVETLVDESQEPGVYQIQWDGRTGISHVRSGIYFYRLTVGAIHELPLQTKTRKLILLH